ncbi:MAG: T9SS type A sorting domain-containing protein [Ignavibacteriaceae bacterium]|nr:T9SS type A sorting domain-containing protein [Ignavibacteriaceae bacterium]MCW8812580.1 T9SS type A sorting domain-containing protein [Chlorobium sp.]MCW8817110.1 T9SS type A sorting domain-containing protein [Ignavibacteriaceae bacterium]MCW9095355.1 T9SS type A sorting domain-containing protein [Ignavibacteriaceae bacterium]MCW9097005.1 T9SS type A sorting domain-containing protein [Ignavibacteriaceae bacterium]
MRALKISLLVFILTITLFAQNEYLIHNENISLTPFSLQTNYEPTQWLRQKLTKISNYSNEEQAVSEYYLIDSLISESVTGGKLKFLFEYNIDDKIVEWTKFFNDINGNWQIDFKEEYFYDTHYNLIREIYFDWYNAEWDSLNQILYEYNLDDKLILSTIQWYVTGSWGNDARSTYKYDQAGNEITSLTELWQNNQWTNSSMLYNYYSTENRRDSLLSQNWDGNKWQNYSRTSFYYDSLTTFLNYAIAQLWTGNQFQNSFKLNIINDELGNQIQQLEEIWNGNAWVNDIKRVYTYIWNYFESCNAELWNGTNWEPGDTPILVDNPDGFKIAIITHSISIYYIIVNVESTNPNTPSDFSLLQNYPNPFNPTTSLQYAIGSRQFVTLKVYDLLGREIATLVNEEKPAGEYEVEFNATNLPSGIYFYQLNAGEFTEVKKMILLK